MAGSLGEGVAEAVPEVQSGWVPALTETSPAAHGASGQVRVDRDYLDLRVTEEPLDHVLACRPEPGFDDDAQLDADRGRHETGDGTFEMLGELLSACLPEDDGDRSRGVDDNTPARALRQRGRPASS